jgi:hypothetical protein
MSATRPPTIRKPASAGAEVQRVLDRRQRDIHDRAIEREHELDQREQQHRTPPPRVRRASE